MEILGTKARKDMPANKLCVLCGKKILKGEYYTKYSSNTCNNKKVHVDCCKKLIK